MNKLAIQKLIASTNTLRKEINLISDELIQKCPQIDWAYNPLEYAWKVHEKYIQMYGGLGSKTIILGMNPGHGMGNTGIPFGCPEQVRDYLKIKNIKIMKPKSMHPKRKVYGLECSKPEISGRRIWSTIKEFYGSPEKAFSKIYVMNHFPLWMFDKEGKNVTPDKLPLSKSKEIFDLCNINLLKVIDALEAEKVIAVGNYSEKMIRKALKQKELSNLILEKIPHPSPANPLANKEKGNVWKNIVKDILP